MEIEIINETLQKKNTPSGKHWILSRTTIIVGGRQKKNYFE